MNKLLSLLILLYSFIASAEPHLTQQAQTNLLLNPTLNGTTNWTLKHSLLFDPLISRSDDGSGSIKLSNAFFTSSSDYDWVVSRTYSVTQGQTYTLSAYMLTNEFPAPIAGIILIFRKPDGSWLQNAPTSLKTVSESNEWQEIATQFRTPQGASYVQVYAMHTQQRKNQSADIWIDNFHLTEGISYAEPPSSKQAFNGSHTRIDTLGNVMVSKDGVFEQFVPLCIHADNSRPDWSIYSEQGFNCNMWAGSAAYIEKAKNAVSDFNPEGMMSGFQIANFIMPGNQDYADIQLLESRINEITNAGLENNLLWYYWDNEKEQLAEWAVPLSVTSKIRQFETGHPIYMLMDNEGLTRSYKTAHANMIDVTGDYINVGQHRDNLGLINVNKIEKQTAPLSIAQINYGTGLKFRARIYSAIANGAKGFSIWRDDYLQAGTLAGPIENTPWWNDLPNIRAEIDLLKPIIAQPHWTDWKVNLASTELDFGTRNYEGKGYIILANEHDVGIQTNITITDLPYQAQNLIDALTGQQIGAITGNSFTVLVPAYGSLMLKLN